MVPRNTHCFDRSAERCAQKFFCDFSRHLCCVDFKPSCRATNPALTCFPFIDLRYIGRLQVVVSVKPNPAVQGSPIARNTRKIFWNVSNWQHLDKEKYVMHAFC